jgi:ABC-type nitrate/sulfonate/bicarbonate transport system substrate-binding protein
VLAVSKPIESCCSRGEKSPGIQFKQENNMKHITALLALTLAIFLSAGLATDAEAKDLNFGWPGESSWTTLPFKVGADKGFFEREGLEVRFITFRGTNLMVSAP